MLKNLLRIQESLANAKVSAGEQWPDEEIYGESTQGT